MKNKNITKNLLVYTLSSIVFFSLGYFAQNSHSQPQYQTSEESASNESQIIDFYKKFAYSNRGKLVENYTEKYDYDTLHIYSPVLTDKLLQVYQYDFMGDTILEKKVSLNDGLWINIAEHHINKDNPSEILDSYRFATFSGYENYELYPNFVYPRILNSREQYTSKNEKDPRDFFLEYTYGPKNISDVSLISKIDFFYNVKGEQNPALLIIGKSVNGNSQGKYAPEIQKAIKELQDIADTVVTGDRL